MAKVMRAATVHDLTIALAALVREQEAAALARAILSTCDRHRDGFMAHATMTKHVGSLWGAVDAKGLRAEVESILGVR